MKPTAEQAAAVDLFLTGESFKVLAVAGSGKTSVLQMMAEADPFQKGRLLAFNKSIITEAQARMPRNLKCQTAHSLAYGGTPAAFRERLNNSRRIRSRDLAAQLGITSIVISNRVDGRTERKTLEPWFLGGLVMNAIERFCQSADPVPSASHFNYVDGIDFPDPDGNRTWRNNLLLRQELLPVLIAAWLDLCDPAGRLPYRHSHYLKQYELRGPNLRSDYIMVDECQPLGTEVLVTDGRPSGALAGRGRGTAKSNRRVVPIENVRPGDRVVSYFRSGCYMRRSGSVVTEVRRRHYDGELVCVTAETGERSRYTVDHKCIVSPAAAVEGRWLVYMMKRGDRFRIGMTAGQNGKAQAGLRWRLREEQGDAIWVLDTFASKEEARQVEAVTAWGFGVPDLCFNSRGADSRQQETLDVFWDKMGDLSERALACLRAFGRRIEYPFWDRSTGPFIPGRRSMVLRACNLLDGMRMIRSEPMVSRPRSDTGVVYTPVRVHREFYSGDVISLEVDEDHTYVADGLVTHNCQDLSPVLMSIVEQQECQIIYVGDSYQAVNQWTGAVDAFKRTKIERATPLTKSWRFGPAIAEQANEILDELDADLRVVGNDAVTSVVGPVTNPACHLARTNAGAVRRVLDELGDGGQPHLVGGGQIVSSFAQAARDLQTGKRTSHNDLACFSTWEEVQGYVVQDEQGDELRLMVNLVDKFGPSAIMNAVDRMPVEAAATLVCSTAHKVKGREWDTVALDEDFPTGKRHPNSEELQLLYVAVTRARHAVDITNVGYLNPVDA